MALTENRLGSVRLGSKMVKQCSLLNSFHCSVQTDGRLRIYKQVGALSDAESRQVYESDRRSRFSQMVPDFALFLLVLKAQFGLDIVFHQERNKVNSHFLNDTIRGVGCAENKQVT